MLTLEILATLQARITALAQAVGADIKSVWSALDGKSDAAHTHSAATTSAAGFMSGADKTKLDGIATGANAYTHPESHPPSIIAQDASNRFVTDAEKTAWNAKQAALVSGTNIKTINGASLLGAGNMVIDSAATASVALATVGQAPNELPSNQHLGAIAFLNTLGATQVTQHTRDSQPGDVWHEWVSNTQLRKKFHGFDGVIRTITETYA